MADREPMGWWAGVAWTLVLSALLVLLNAGLFSWAPEGLAHVPALLQLDVAAVRQGEWYRLLTGNLVHWDPQHFYLDGAAFLVAGLLGERYYRNLYPLLLLTTALVVGVAGLWCLPERAVLRGLSGVNAGQFAALVIVECLLAYRHPLRWLWVAPASLLFLTWLIYGATTGRFFAGALFMQEGGEVAAWAHVAGAVAAVVVVVLAAVTGGWSLPPEDSDEEP